MEPMAPSPAPSRRFLLAGAGVHVYTASGTVLAFLVVVAALEGNATRALWLGLAALIIDGSDGMLARRLRVKETIPQFDGARLDDIVDYITYVFAPVVLLWTGGFLPRGHWGEVLAALPLLASSYQFCRVDAKTEDHYFLGFPSYWNVIAFYAVVMGLTPSTLAIIFIVCSVLVFVPVKYIYPSRTVVLRRTNLVFAAIWLITYAVLLVQMPAPSPLVIGVSLGYVAYYAGASVYLTLRGRRAATENAGATAGDREQDVDRRPV
ncbi:MAG: phosphatidylcholine synthase [Actinomycetota bacterium]|nr:phosphatidylcholine synthase [Actinomycetota bacterium]